MYHKSYDGVVDYMRISSRSNELGVYWLKGGQSKLKIGGNCSL